MGELCNYVKTSNFMSETMSEANTHTENGLSMKKILSCDDSERLDHIIYIFAKNHMVGKRYEAKVWHPYFRSITTDAIVFYQNNAALFYDDCQYDNEQFQLTGTTFIHGDLHVGQFPYHFSDVTDERVFKVQRYTRTEAPITQDLKRLAANLALIAYYQGFSDTEMMEVLEMFTRQYIKSVLSPDKNSVKKRKSIESDPTHHKIRDIHWQSINTVKSLMILAKQLAIVTAHLHCQPPIPISVLKDSCAETLQTGLSSFVQQQKLIDEICCFAMIYAEIAERDYRLFFKNFRNEIIFQCVNTLKNAKIARPLGDTRREAVLIVGGGIGGMATALSFAQAGIRVRLIEKSLEIAEVGAGMQLAPNCSRLLDRLGILQQVQANAVFPKQIVWMDAISGARLTCIDLGPKFVEAFGYPYIVVHRADLLHALYQACLASCMVTMETNRMAICVD